MSRYMVLSLRAGVAIAFIYIGTIVLSSLLYPGYSHSRQLASELGAADAPHAWIFNTGLALTGGTIIIAAWGFLQAFQCLAANRILGWVTAMAIALFGLALMIGASFPLPDSRHAAYGLRKGMLAGPLLFAATLWPCQGTRRLRILLIVNNVALIAAFLLVMGVGGFAARDNAGIIQRIAILTIFPWMSLSAYSLLGYIRALGKGQERNPTTHAVEQTRCSEPGVGAQVDNRGPGAPGR